MIKKLYLIAGTFIILLIIGFLAKPVKHANDKLLKVESVPVYYSSGWGYDILVDHKIFIHQEYIPAIAGKKRFSSKVDAIKTAAVAITKIIKGKKPIITIADLSGLKIAF